MKVFAFDLREVNPGHQQSIFPYQILIGTISPCLLLRRFDSSRDTTR